MAPTVGAPAVTSGLAITRGFDTRTGEERAGARRDQAARSPAMSLAVDRSLHCWGQYGGYFLDPTADVLWGAE